MELQRSGHDWATKHSCMQAQTGWLPWLDGFLVSLLRSKMSLLNVSLRIVSCIKKYCLAEKCHLNLTVFFRMWLKLSTILKYMVLTHITYLCEEMDTEHTCLLLKTNVRWFSKGRSLVRVSELWELLQINLLEKWSPLAAYFSDTEWVAKLDYLCDIVSLLKELTLSFQGRTTTVFKSAEKSGCIRSHTGIMGAMSD